MALTSNRQLLKGPLESGSIVVLSLIHTCLPQVHLYLNKTITPEVIGRVKKRPEKLKMEASNRGSSKRRPRSGSSCTLSESSMRPYMSG